MGERMKHMYLKTPLLLAITAALTTGCVSTAEKEQIAAQKVELSKLQTELEQKQSALTAQEQKSQKLEADLAAAKKSGAEGEQPQLTNGLIESDLLPPNAKAGECYARVWRPAEYKNVSEQVLVKEESSKITSTPAEYKFEEKRVMVSPATYKLKVVPAEYGTEKTRNLVSAERIAWRATSSRESALLSDDLIDFAKKHNEDKLMASATPGMCFHEHRTPAKYEQVAQQVLVSEAYDVFETVPAQYEWKTETVVVKEASSKLVEVPATFKTVEEKILVKPAHTAWKKGSGPIQKIDEATGEIMCLVEVPAEYKIVKKRVIDAPATTKKIAVPAVTKTIKTRVLVAEAKDVKTTVPAKYKTIYETKLVSDGDLVWHEVHNKTRSKKTRTGRTACLVKEPAQYQTVTKRVVTKPATTVKSEIPAVYKTVQVKTLVKDAQTTTTKIPAVYKEVTRQELVGEGRMEWRPILCDTNMTRSRITDVQRALKAKGYNPGEIDGVYGQQTAKAMHKFQADNKLPTDKYLNIQSLNALGVSAK